MKNKTIEIIDRLKKLFELGYTRDQVVKVVQDLDLPLGPHLYIMGNWSKLGLK